MKKFVLFLLIGVVSAFAFGCNKADESSVDKALVGAWQIDDEGYSEYYIFTEDSKVRIARGSVYFEGDAVFNGGVYASNFYYMAGELSYKVEGDKVTFDDGAGTVQVLKKVDYSAPELKKYDDFKTDNPLVGTWFNEEYNDSYTFNSDGSASYNVESPELSYSSHIDYIYTEKDGTLYLTYDAGEGSQEMTAEFSVNGDTLNLEGSEYTRQ